MAKVENQDYELVPVELVNNNQAWDVKLLTGDFAEAVIRFGNVAVDGKADVMTFNFTIVEDPYGDLDADNNPDLQAEAGDVLLAIIEQSIEDKSLVIKDKGDPIEQQY